MMKTINSCSLHFKLLNKEINSRPCLQLPDSRSLVGKIPACHTVFKGLLKGILGNVGNLVEVDEVVGEEKIKKKTCVKHTKWIFPLMSSSALKALWRFIKEKDASFHLSGYRSNFSDTSRLFLFPKCLFFSFFLSRMNRVDRLERELNPNTVCVLVQKRKKKKQKRHVCSTSGNRQLYLSQLSYKLGKIVTFTLKTVFFSREFNTVCMKIWVHNNNYVFQMAFLFLFVSFCFFVLATKVSESL